jgi:hypothetical protein
VKFFPALLLTLGLFWLAAVLDRGASLRLGFVFGSRPEFALAFAAAFTVASRPSVAASAGFLAGLVAGALSGANLTQYILSGTLVCFFGAYLTKLPLEQRWWIVYLEMAGIILAARLVFMFMAPPPQVGQFAAASAFSALLSAAIGLAVYPLARKIFGSKEI